MKSFKYIVPAVMLSLSIGAPVTSMAGNSKVSAELKVRAASYERNVSTVLSDAQRLASFSKSCFRPSYTLTGAAHLLKESLHHGDLSLAKDGGKLSSDALGDLYSNGCLHGAEVGYLGYQLSIIQEYISDEEQYTHELKHMLADTDSAVMRQSIANNGGTTNV